MKQIKTITIDQLKPGMFIVGMDQPWYRTPFLLHKRLIRDTKDIALLRQHGIRELKIDPSQGLDAEPNPPGDAPPTANTQATAAALQPNLAGKPASKLIWDAERSLTCLAEGLRVTAYPDMSYLFF